jgi:hypothetical protein
MAADVSLGVSGFISCHALSRVSMLHHDHAQLKTAAPGLDAACAPALLHHAPAAMNEAQIEHSIRSATGIARLMVAEMPVEAASTPAPRRCFIVNIGPLPINLADARTAWDECLAIVDTVLESCVHEPALSHCRLGVSLFVEPGGQAFRAVSGSYDITPHSTRPHRLSGVYSNIRSFLPLLASA